jgi:hypothetical protein
MLRNKLAYRVLCQTTASFILALLITTYYIDAVQGAAQSIKAAVGMICSSDCMYWYPKYGCAVMVMKQDKDDCGIQLQPDMADLYLICLDDWQHHLHR